MVGVEANEKKGELEQGVAMSGFTADQSARDAGWKQAPGESGPSNSEQELESSAIKIQALARGKRDRKRLKVEEKPAKQDSTKKFGSSLNVYNKGPLRVLHPNPATSKSFKHTEHKQGHDELESSAVKIQALARGNKERRRLKTDAPETEGKGKLEKGNEVETAQQDQLLPQKKPVKQSACCCVQ